MTRWLCAGFLMAATALANAQGVARPDVPEKIQAPADEVIILQARAVGSQIYTCQQSSEGKFAWTLKAPEAELRDPQGGVIVRHYAGPAWKHNDGSEVTGKAVARVDSPDGTSIPWLLVTATGHSGDGALSRVANIQRIHTKDGQPPAAAECNLRKVGVEAKSSYSADYIFYAPAK